MFGWSAWSGRRWVEKSRARMLFCLVSQGSQAVHGDGLIHAVQVP